MTKKPKDTLYMLAKYFYDQGLKPKKVLCELDAFMSQYYLNYEPMRWDQTLEYIVKKTKKQKLVEVAFVPITKNELQSIKGLKSKESQRVMFAILAIAKFYNRVFPNNNDWVNRSFADIFNMAHILSCSRREQALLVGRLKDCGLIAFSKKVDNVNLNVQIVDEDSEPVIKITDFRELGYVYLEHLGESFVRCEVCGRMTRQNSRKTVRFCKEHKGYVQQVTKTICCEDCGCAVIASAKNTKTNRCRECQSVKNREKKRVWWTDNN